jgi:hypothetical protein
MGQTVRAVLGIRGEPSTPADAAQGMVWRSIVDLLDSSGAQNDFVSVTDVPRQAFAKYPWSVGGGGAADLKAQLDAGASAILGDFAVAIGRVTHTGCDEAYFAPHGTWSRRLISKSNVVTLVEGDTIRGWSIVAETDSILPYDEDLVASLQDPEHPVLKHLWHFNTFANYEKLKEGWGT